MSSTHCAGSMNTAADVKSLSGKFRDLVSKYEIKRKIVCLKASSVTTLMAGLILSGHVLAQGGPPESDAVEFTISAGIVSAPAYLGGDDYQASLLPNVTVNIGERWSASLRGIEYTAFARAGWRVAPLLSYDFGREEQTDDNPFALYSDDSTDLMGTGDIDGTVELGSIVEYEARLFSAKLKILRGVDGGHDGLTGEASVSYRGKFTGIGPPAFFSLGPAISFGDSSYNSTFFDISAEQSTASGLGQYDADGGVNSIGLHSSVFMPLSGSTSVVGFLQYDQLTGDIADSSIVSERGSEAQVTTGFFVNYRF